ncbi:glycosyltransferase [bacterium]
MLSISIIIPTLNEETSIQSLLIYLNRLDSNLHCIIVDGGSRDNTVYKAKAYSTVITASRGRGAQMNAGAHIAEGDILWFLHADISNEYRGNW